MFLTSSRFWLLITLFSILASEPGTCQNDTLTAENMMQLSLEELMSLTVSTASKSQEQIHQAPAVISIITSQEIQSFGGLTLVDVLNRAANVYITGSYYFPDNLAALRGDIQTHTSSHVLILLDGRPCRESFYGGVDLAIYNTLPLASVERIEIIRGPGSVLYGTNAFSGVINIITKKAETNNATISAQGGSFGTFGGTFSHAYHHKQTAVASSIQYLNQAGWDFSAVDQAGVLKTISYGQENLGVNLSAQVKNFTLRTFYGNAFRNIMGERPLFPKDGSVNTLHTYRGLVDLGYEHTFSPKWSATWNATYNAFSQRSFRDERPVHFYSNDGLLEMTHFFDPTDKLHVTAGLLGNYISGVGNGVDKSLNAPVALVQHHAELRWSAYAQADYQLFSFLKLITGGQINKIPHLPLDFVPRAGTIISIKPAFGLKALYGQAFKAAAQAERFTLIPDLNYGNPDLKPEKIQTTDLQVYYHKPALQLTVGYFFSKQTNTIVRTPYLNNAVTYTNQGSIAFEGAELELQAKPSKRITIHSSLTYQTNRNDEGEKDVTAISNCMVKGGVAYIHPKGLTLGVFHSFFSKPVDVINSQTELEPDKQRRLVNPVPQAFNLLSVNLQLNLSTLLSLQNSPNLTLFGYGNNLLNEKVYNPEFSRRNINSLPANGGAALYGGIKIDF